MVSAHAAADKTQEQQNVIIKRTRFQHYAMPMNRVLCLFVTKVLLLGCAFSAAGQQRPQPTGSAAPAIYRELLNPVLTTAGVHHIRDVSINREDLHIILSDGTIGLLQAVDGHITGAAFEGTGEILLVPPNRAERTSLALFTGSAVLEQHFNSAYFRFFDDRLLGELQAGFRPAENAEEFVAEWEQPVKLLARVDSLPLLQTMKNAQDPPASYLHVRLGGTQLGVFDVFFNPSALEQITVAQERLNDKAAFFDTWVSFPMRSMRQRAEQNPGGLAEFELSDYSMRVKVQPPTDLTSQTEFTFTPRRSGLRMSILELSRYLRVSEVRVDGERADFIQNEAVSGSELSRRGDDLIGLVFPHVLEKDRPVRVLFKYSGPVMFSAGGELLYVGERGTWYPSAGPSYSNYSLTFEYPDEWLLVATGKRVSESSANGWRTSRFVSEKPIARAGFNLGKFETASATSGGVTIRAYAAKNVEQSLAAPAARAGKRIEPAKEVQDIVERTTSAVRFFSGQLDAFPYSDLEVTQLPGFLSQSWPGLIYLSSMAFLSPEERRVVGIHDAFNELLLSRLMLAHETAHQWWGDAVDWESYRDEWIIEAMANYTALIMLERDDPQAMKTALDYYKSELLRETSSGIVAEAGPVTLGARLTSSRFPQAYQRVLYGRGTWLIHMLRTMLRNASPEHNDARFFSALKRLVVMSPGHKISTRDLQRAFEDVLPPSLNYEGQKSLDWFFDSWVNDISIPQFTLENLQLARGRNGVRVTGAIRENNAAKDSVTAVPLYSIDEKGGHQFLATVFVDETREEFTLDAPAGTRQIVIDPDNTLLRR